MTQHVGIGGQWRNIVSAAVGVAGQWRNVIGAWVGVGGQWRQFWSDQQAPVVNPLPGGLVQDSQPDGATAALFFEPDGTIFFSGSNVPAAQAWHANPSPGVGAGFFLRATLVGAGIAPNLQGTLGVWLSLGSRVPFGYVATETHNPAGGVLMIEIATDASGINVVTQTVVGAHYSVSAVNE